MVGWFTKKNTEVQKESSVFSSFFFFWDPNKEIWGNSDFFEWEPRTTKIMKKLQGYGGGERNVSFKLQKEEPAKKWTW